MSLRRLNMARIYLLFATFSFTSSVVSSSASCSRVANATFFNQYYLYGSEPEMFYDFTLHECVHKCRSDVRCKAFLFYRPDLQCALYYFDSTTHHPGLGPVDYFPKSAIYDISAWNVGPCAGHTCEADERCYPAGTNFVCRKAIDVCFKRMPVEVCFRRYKNLFMPGADEYVLDEVLVDTLQECVLHCHGHAPEYTTISYLPHEPINCICYTTSVAEYQLLAEFVGLSFYPEAAIYEKLN